MHPHGFHRTRYLEYVMHLLQRTDGSNCLSARRRGWLIAIVAIALLLATSVMGAFVIAGHNMDRPPTAAQAAELDCRTTTKPAVFSLMGELDYTLPNVGAPRGIIVVPSCFINEGVKSSDLSRHIKNVDVYIIVSHQQLEKLFAGDTNNLEDNYPYGLGGRALNGLISSKMQKEIESDPSHVLTTYFVTSGDMPTQVMDKGHRHSYEYLVAPFDIVTGEHYSKLPFTTQHPLFDDGPPIVLGGTK